MRPSKLTTETQAKRILEFFLSKSAFWWDISEWNQEPEIRKRINNALTGKNLAAYWFYESDGNVIAAGSVEMDPGSKGGFFIGWFAVHKDNRRKGLGTRIIKECEKYVRDNRGKFITIDTAQDNKQANAFYQARGYKQVGLIPNYYKPRVGKVIYWKNITS